MSIARSKWWTSKSEKKPDLENDRERLRQYQSQLEVYAHLIEERTGHKVSRMHLYYTGEQDGNPYVTFAKDNQAIGKTVARFDEIVRRIENAGTTRLQRALRSCARIATCAPIVTQRTGISGKTSNEQREDR